VPSPEALAEFQDALLVLLDQGLPTDQIRVKLREDPAFAAFRDYATALEPRMLEVAVELVKKWGRRASERREDVNQTRQFVSLCTSAK
jgi:hypothetical protein